MTTVEVFRESTDAELDARILADVRAYRERVNPSDLLRVVLTFEELDALLRVAAERDELRREVCTEPDPKYIVRSCPSCAHEPHGYGFLCNRRTCACRNERRTA